MKNGIQAKKESPRIFENEELSYLNVGSKDEISIKDLANLVSELVEYSGSIIWDQSKPDGTPRKNLTMRGLKALDGKDQ